MKGILQIAAYVAVWTVAILFTLGLAIIPLALLLFLTFFGAQNRAERASKTLSTTLMPNERLVVEALQSRVFALWSRRVVLAITDSRIVVVRRGLLGGFKMQDMQWKDLRDAMIEQNVLSSICGSNLKFMNLGGGLSHVLVDGIEDNIASSMYARSQAEEQAWEEKRRIRGIEEVRAAAGGVVVHAAPQQSGLEAAPPRPANRMLDEIQKAKSLFDDGVISDAEFQEMKSKILASA